MVQLTNQADAVAAVPRAVFDCPVFVQAFFGSSGPAAACLDLVEAGAVRLLVSLDVLAEVREVLARPELAARRRWITSDRIQAFVERVVRFSELVDPVPHSISYARDFRDEPYLDLTVAGHANFLVSRDRDLLDLAGAGASAHDGVRRALRGIAIVDPVAFLASVRGRAL